MFLNQGGPAVPTAPTPTGGEQFPTVNVNMQKLADDDDFLGDANAEITIVEFSDYECPFCGRFWSQTLPSIKSNYINTGKARLVYRDFPLGSIHANAQKAAEAAECAGDQGKYFEMHDKIFQGQAALNTNNFKAWAADLGLDTNAFNTCLDSGAKASEVQKDLQDGSSVGIQGTPGFLIGKTGGSTAILVSGAYPYSAFEQIINQMLSS